VIGWQATVAFVWTVRKFQKTAKSISKMSRRVALRHSNIFSSARNPFTAV